MILVEDGEQKPMKEAVDLKRKDSRKKQVYALKAHPASGQCSGLGQESFL